jgi:hypothetical protein
MFKNGTEADSHFKKYFLTALESSHIIEQRNPRTYRTRTKRDHRSAMPVNQKARTNGMKGNRSIVRNE